ncbi:MAG: hypothetical protein SGBAC_004489 [Bacillariaceae sp.]
MNVSLLTKLMLSFIAIWLVACTVFAKYYLRASGVSLSTNGQVKSLWDELMVSHSARSNGLRKQPWAQSQLLSSSSLSSTELLGTKLFPIKPPEKLVKRELILTVPLYYNRQIRIQLRPEWSPGSLDYFLRLVEHKCSSCSLYRLARQHGDGSGEGVVLGVMQNSKSVPLNTQRGICPEGYHRHYHEPNEDNGDEDESEVKADENGKKYDDDNPRENCEDCECQGPILQRGMVAWVGGTPGGPEFFINLYEDAVKYEGSRHAVFGEIVDYETFDLLGEIMEEDTSLGDSRVLRDELNFYIDLQ